MIKHIVCYKFREPTKENLEKARSLLLSMTGKVKGVKDIIVGFDFLHSERSYDLVLEVILEDNKLQDYQNDPYHIKNVKSFMHQMKEKSVSVDYNF